MYFQTHYMLVVELQQKREKNNFMTVSVNVFVLLVLKSI